MAGTLTVIRNGRLESDLDLAGFNLLNASGVTGFLPSQVGQGGKFLTTNGTIASWATISIDLSPYQVKTGTLALGGFSSITGALGVGNIPDLSGTYQPKATTLTSWAGITRAGGFDTFVATPTLVNLKSLVTDETTVGWNLLTLANPGAVAFLQLNADNSVTTQSAGSQRTALGVGTGDSPTFTGLVLSGGGLTGGATGLSLAAGGTNQNITLTPSGTGRILPGADGTTVLGSTSLRFKGLNISTSMSLLGNVDEAAGEARFASNGSAAIGIQSGFFTMGSAVELRWTSGSLSVAADTGLARNAPGVIEINNGTAGTYRDLILRNITLNTGGIYKINTNNVIRVDATLENWFYGRVGNLTMTGDHNLSVGFDSFGANTSGGYNVSIGNRVLDNNNTGAHNMGIGTFSLRANTSGNYNVAVGEASLNTQTTASDNVGIGFEAGLLITGGDNTAIGFKSLHDVTSGQKNIGIGSSSGLGITTGSSNTIIGSNVTGLATNLANTVIIADGDGNKRIYVDSSANVGIAGLTAFGTSAAKVFGLPNATEPSTSPIDMVQLFSVDLSAGNATLGLRTETAVVTETITSDRTLSVRINGTTYKILLHT